MKKYLFVSMISVGALAQPPTCELPPFITKKETWNLDKDQIQCESSRYSVGGYDLDSVVENIDIKFKNKTWSYRNGYRIASYDVDPLNWWCEELLNPHPAELIYKTARFTTGQPSDNNCKVWEHKWTELHLANRNEALKEEGKTLLEAMDQSFCQTDPQLDRRSCQTDLMKRAHWNISYHEFEKLGLKRNVKIKTDIELLNQIIDSTPGTANEKPDEPYENISETHWIDSVTGDVYATIVVEDDTHFGVVLLIQKNNISLVGTVQDSVIQCESEDRASATLNTYLEEYRNGPIVTDDPIMHNAAQKSMSYEDLKSNLKERNLQNLGIYPERFSSLINDAMFELNLIGEACSELQYTALSLADGSSDSTYVVIRSNDDYCDGGNEYGLIVRLDESNASLVALIGDSSVQLPPQEARKVTAVKKLIRAFITKRP